MTDADELQLQSEIDEIMKSVDGIMKKIENALPVKEEEPAPPPE